MKYVEFQGKRYIVIDDRGEFWLVYPVKKDGTRSKKGGTPFLKKIDCKEHHE